MSQLWIVDTMEGDAEYVVSPGIVTERGDDVPVSNSFATSLAARVCTLHILSFDKDDNFAGKRSYTGEIAKVMYRIRYAPKQLD